MRYIKTILLLTIAIVGLIPNADAQQRKRKAKQRTVADLTGTYWRLYEMNGKPVVTPPDSKEVYIKLLDNKKGELEGYAGCNLLTGQYTQGKETLTFEPSATLRACDDMTVENYVFNALNNTNRHEINGLYLLLYNNTYLLAIFEAKYYEED
jgi:heat shock protein HslJ